MKITESKLRRIIRKAITEARIADSAFSIGDRVKYDALGNVRAGEIIDIEEDGVNYHGRRDTSPTANKRTLLTIQFDDGKVRKVASHHMVLADQEIERTNSY